MNDKSSISFNMKSGFPKQKLAFKICELLPILLKIKLLRIIVAKVLPNVHHSRIMPGFTAVIGDNIRASNAYLSDTKFFDYAPITIGEGTIFSGGNVLITSSHEFEDFYTVIAKPIHIGKNVWITHRCIVLGGVTIGDNSVIGAGSVVTRDIPSNVLAAGNPCRVIKEISHLDITKEITL